MVFLLLLLLSFLLGTVFACQASCEPCDHTPPYLNCTSAYFPAPKVCQTLNHVMSAILQTSQLINHNKQPTFSSCRTESVQALLCGTNCFEISHRSFPMTFLRRGLTLPLFLILPLSIFPHLCLSLIAFSSCE